MTQKQLEAAKKAYREAGASFEDCIELRCIDMMHSILVYNYHPSDEEFPFPYNNRFLSQYIQKLGIDRAIQLWEEQIPDYRKAEVGFDGYDWEGCSYNYCKWADD